MSEIPGAASGNAASKLMAWLVLLTFVAVVGFGGFYYLDVYRPLDPSPRDRNIEKALEAIRRDPNDIQPRLMLAGLYIDSNQPERAIAEYKEALKLAPDLPVIFTGLGVAYYRNKQPDQALEVLTQVIERFRNVKYRQFSSDLENAQYYAGLIYLDKGDYEQAVEMFSGSLEMNGADADAHFYVGKALFGLEKYEEALSHTQLASRFMPDFAEAFYYSGLCYEKLGKKEDALVQFKLALQQKKDYKEASEAIMRVEAN